MSAPWQPVALTPLPRVGAWIPGWAVRGILLAVAGGFGLAMFEPGFWLVAALSLAAITVIRPLSAAPITLTLLCAGSLLWRGPDATDWRFFLLLAAGHLLQLLAAFAGVVPLRARLQLRVLGRPLLRFAVVQCPAQLLAAGVLLVLPGWGSSPIPALGYLAAAAMALLAVLLLRPLLSGRQPPA